MARIIGGIAASHTPTIGFAYDRDSHNARNPKALYSVAGQGATTTGWDKDAGAKR